jgi:VanZ family protein
MSLPATGTPSAPATPAPPPAGWRAGYRLAVAGAVLAALWAALLFWLSSKPDPLPELTSRFSDKILHFAAYGTLGALLRLGLATPRRAPRRALALAVLLASLYGASDEWHQWFVPGRSCDVRDWVADVLGAAAGAALAEAFLRRLRARASIRD